MKIYLTLPEQTDDTSQNIESSVRKLDLELRARNTNVLWLVIFDLDNLVANITGATIFFTVKSKLSDTDDSAAFKKNVTSHYDAVNGETKIELSDSDTQNLLGNYLYSIKIKQSDNTIYTLCEGIVTFKQELSTRTS